MMIVPSLDRLRLDRAVGERGVLADLDAGVAGEAEALRTPASIRLDTSFCVMPGLSALVHRLVDLQRRLRREPHQRRSRARSLIIRQPATTGVALTIFSCGAACAMLSLHTNLVVSSMPRRPVAMPRSFSPAATRS